MGVEAVGVGCPPPPPPGLLLTTRHWGGRGHHPSTPPAPPRPGTHWKKRGVGTPPPKKA